MHRIRSITYLFEIFLPAFLFPVDIVEWVVSADFLSCCEQGECMKSIKHRV